MFNNYSATYKRCNTLWTASYRKSDYAILIRQSNKLAKFKVGGYATDRKANEVMFPGQMRN